MEETRDRRNFHAFALRIKEEHTKSVMLASVSYQFF